MSRCDPEGGGLNLAGNSLSDDFVVAIGEALRDGTPNAGLRLEGIELRRCWKALELPEAAREWSNQQVLAYFRLLSKLRLGRITGQSRYCVAVCPLALGIPALQSLEVSDIDYAGVASPWCTGFPLQSWKDNIMAALEKKLRLVVVLPADQESSVAPGWGLRRLFGIRPNRPEGLIGESSQMELEYLKTEQIPYIKIQCQADDWLATFRRKTGLADLFDKANINHSHLDEADEWCKIQGEIHIYSRNQENNTSKYPDIIKRLPSAYSADKVRPFFLTGV